MQAKIVLWSTTLELLALYLYWWSSSPALIIDFLYNPWWSIVITEQAAHIDVSLFLLGLLFLHSGGLGGSGNGGTHGDSNGGSWADVGEEVLDVLSLEGLGEEGGPVCLNLVAGGLDDLSELVTLNISLDSWTFIVIRWKRWWRIFPSHSMLSWCLRCLLINLRWFRSLRRGGGEQRKRSRARRAQP